MPVLRNVFFPLAIIFLSLFVVSACSSEGDDQPRMPEDLAGVWSPSDSIYLEFGKDYTVHNLEIMYQDGESIGIWNNDAYIYEPGYHIVIFLSGTRADVYQVVELSENSMTWCWVNEVILDDSVGKETIGKILGNIIKEAQEGFKLDPDLFQSFRKIPEDEFFTMLEKLDIMYPW